MQEHHHRPTTDGGQYRSIGPCGRRRVVHARGKRARTLAGRVRPADIPRADGKTALGEQRQDTDVQHGERNGGVHGNCHGVVRPPGSDGCRSCARRAPLYPRGMRSTAFVLGAMLGAAVLPAQGPPANGPEPFRPGWHALTGATVIVRPGERLAPATIVVRDGRITAVGKDLTPPAGATIHDCQGLTIWPAFVESLLTVDVPQPDADSATTHWHPAILPQRSGLQGDGATAQDRKALRELGFAAAAIAPTGGVVKGTAAVVLLDEPPTGGKTTVVREHAYLLCSLQSSFGGHPSAQMGAIALLRQTLLDADWYRRSQQTAAARPELRAQAPAPSAALQALVDRAELPLAFDVDDELEVLRVAKLATEASRTAFAFGSGMEFRRLAAIAAQKLPIVVPLHFPEPPDVSTIARSERVSLRHLLSWEQAPTNSKRLLDAGCRIAWTTARLPQRGDFRERVADAMACGVTADQALAALTTVPAELLGVQDRLGTIAPGRLANLVVATGEPFAAATKLRTIWVGGQRHELSATPMAGLDGAWQMTLDTTPPTGVALQVQGRDVQGKIGDQDVAATAVNRDDERLDFALAGLLTSQPGTVLLHGRLAAGQLQGTAVAPDGSEIAWTATRTGDVPQKTDKPRTFQPPPLTPLTQPFGAFGLAAMPAALPVFVRDVTLWTGDDRGILEHGALLVRDGAIAFAGRLEDAPAPPSDAIVIDGKGKHVTPGIIDCHSHTGISRGINEGGQAVTAEVRVQDVIDPDDVNWYRELAGGVTSVSQLHGSANAIGGQSSTVKLRWGCAHPDDMAFAGGVPGIKFALGENPRRANSDGPNPRYPNTRMGVEALIRDRFVAAAEYRRRLLAYDALPPRDRAAVLPPRRDLELDALAEVLTGARRVHCHAYRQDEIFMLCKLAGEFGFKIGTFQHVLEGYKVADTIAQHAIGASSFSDWWAYKFEVYDAIPDNGAILHAAGVLVSFNSDSNELARRLNTEAGKAVKYGGVPRAAALQFVTLNPAIQLGIDGRTGSLSRGKDGDFAIWSDDPLSYRARCEATFVDGRMLFSLDRDQDLRTTAAKERARLLQKALAAGGERKGRSAKDPRDAFWAAEDLTADYCCRDCDGGGR
ncbi:MAG: amidohydrolase family protein [Planctomycetes bacterium]|nr:amidohydrolase family protein [Planctomycetota bacterium]